MMQKQLAASQRANGTNTTNTGRESGRKCNYCKRVHCVNLDNEYWSKRENCKKAPKW